ncbi:MAG: ferrous iron transport protein A [Leptolyngbyaceae cyanobacterium CSU_1_3]|nr:ferrous iron transport protein A [Leptolyngbyaceae cyanobacterium CSU_1_3]
MLTTGFSVQGSSLKLLRAGERGIVTRINTLQDATAQALRNMGFQPGQTITLEQQFPRFVVRVGSQCHALDEPSKNAIYVRIVDH